MLEPPTEGRYDSVEFRLSLSEIVSQVDRSYTPTHV